jgi:type I restriction enzyme R subunit
LPAKPESRAREEIDRQLSEAGWIVQDRAAANLSAGPGVAVREFPLKGGPVDYLLYLDGAAAGAVEAKKEGWTLSGVEAQSKRYSEGLPDALPAYRRPLPFLYESTGKETYFTNLLDPEPRSREVLTFHRPETHREWLQQAGYEQSRRALPGVAEPPAPYTEGDTLRARLKALPPLDTGDLWRAQITAIENLEESLAANKPRALIQMATGSGKTFTAANFTYRLAKFAKAKRILFLVDRGNLGRQAKKEFEQFVTPDDGRKFSELYVVQHLTSNVLDPTAKVVIGTIQRLYSMLQGQEELPEEADEVSSFEAVLPLAKAPLPVAYNPRIPIETFDVIITDEAHRSIYNLWRQVLEYFDAFCIGLTATPSKQTLGFFKQNLVMEYDHERAVADGVNVDFDVFEIRTEITQAGSKVDAGLFVDKRDRQTRERRWEQLDEEFTYDASQLDRAVVAQDQLRTVIRTFRDKLPEIFPGRTEVPKTLIFAKDDSHAEDIVRVVREEFGKGNDFCVKITYKTTGAKPEDLLASFRNSYNPRIAVTVDMIATGTDVRPIEIVFFMRSVRSRTFFEQMKGRGVRVINPTDLRAVTPDARAKDRFVIVDAVGISHEDLTDTVSLEKKPSVSFEKLLEQVAFGNREADLLSSLASRLARLDRQLSSADRHLLTDAADGHSIRELAAALVEALDPDVQVEAARVATGETDPPASAVEEAAAHLLDEAAQPIAANPELRAKLVELKHAYEQTIDTTSVDTMLKAGYSEEATEAARGIVHDFETFIMEHRDQLDALQILFSRPYRRRLTFEQVRELAEAIKRPPRQWTPEVLWQAYERLDRLKVHGSGERTLADLVSLVRFAVHEQDELVPYAEQVRERFDSWLAQQGSAGRTFTAEQLRWLEMTRDQVATSLGVEMGDFDYVPFNQEGGVGRASQLFGPELPSLLADLNTELSG